MNNYKFRGKTAAGKWVYGDLIHTIGGGFSIVECYQFTVKSSVDVLPETVGQWTGRKDVKGREAYEGDFIKDSQEEGVIIFSIDDSAFLVKNKKGDEFLLIGFKNFEIIGKKFDNPELLEDK